MRFYKSKKFNKLFIVPFVIVLTAIMRAIAIQVFTVPFNFAPGGVTGIATIIQTETAIHFNAGYTQLIINIPLLIIAFLFIGKRFTIITAASMALSSIIMILMPYIKFPTYDEVGAEPILAAACSGLISGAAFAMLLKIGGTTGGTDIIATMIQRKFSATNVSWFIIMMDFTVVFASFFVYGMKLTPVLMSITEMLCFSILSDAISSGLKTALKYEVVTKDPEELAAEIIQKLGRGVTCMPATGMYSHVEETVLVCIIRKRQLSKFNEILKKYPNTFAYVTSTSEVMGLGFSDLDDN